MKVHNILQAFQSNLTQKKVSRGGSKGSGVANNDIVSISSEARDLQKATQLSHTELVAETGVSRDARLDEVRNRVAEGHYSSEKVTSQIADTLLKLFNI